MVVKTEFCPTCFTIQGGWWEVRKAIRKAKKKGHLLFEKKKVKKGVHQAVLSTKQYGVNQ